MKKLFLFSMLCIASVLGLRAQTDVTSQYLTNADFSQGPVITADIRGYGKDMVTGDVYGFQSVTGWTSVILSGDNNTASYPNSGMGAGVLAYGSSYQLKGNNVSAPAAGPNASSANGLGFFAVWGCGGYYYQDVTLRAGKYKITFPIYCISGTQNNTTYTGFFPTSGTNRPVAINTTVGQWVNQTTEFTLAAETAGQIRVGYQSTGNGSGANPHLVFDGVKIEYTAAVVKDVLEKAIIAATSANDALGTLGDAIASAQAVYNNANATQDQINAAAATLNAAVELAMDAAGDASFLFSNLGFESCTETTDNAAAGASAAPKNIEGGWTQTSSAAWCSSAVVAYGGAGQVNGASAPSADNVGNSGKTLGISVGWGSTVTYKTANATLPAGVYTVKFHGYNALQGVTQFKSMCGFVPTEGTAQLSTKTAFAYGEWVEDVVSFTLNEATEGYIQVGGQAISGGSGSNAKVFFDNITIGYQSFLAGAKTAWDEAKAAAQAAIASSDYANVTGSEKTALQNEINKAEPTTVDGYNAATEALNTATSTFTAAKASYDAFVAVKTAETPNLAYATSAKKTAVNNAKNVTAPTTAEDAATKAAAISTALRAYYESHAAAENVNGAVDKTSAITNGTDPTNNDGWTWSGNKNDPRSNEPWTDADGTSTHSYFDGGNWSAQTWTTTMEQTISIPAGRYLLTAKGRAAVNTTLKMEAGGQSVDFPHIGASVGTGVFDRGWNDASVEFETDGSNVVIKVTASTQTQYEWFSISNFRLVQLEAITVEMASASDYTALANAISAAEAKTLGFDANEYAPYMNAAALKALAAAKAIDPEAADGNTKEVVTNATQALTSATWTKNTKELDAIYDGQFVNTEANTTSGDINLPGWTKVDGIRLLVKNPEENPGLAYTDGTAAVFSWGGTTLTYGEQAGYTLPLNKHELYELTLKVSGWRDGDLPNVVTVTLDGVSESVNAQALGAKAINIEEGNPFVTLNFYVKPTEDNSILKIYGNHHFTIADLSLKMVPSGDANKLGDIVNSVLGKRQNYSGKSGATLSDVTKFVNKYLK